MRLNMKRIGRCAALGVLTAMAVVVTCGTGVSQARGVFATKYYEDTEGNLCVGVETAGGFPSSCEWGAQKGTENTGTGYRVLNDNTSGSRNAAFGFGALLEDESGGYDTAVGFNSCFHNISGINNTCIGASSQLRNTTGKNNTSVGGTSLFHDTSGGENTAIGVGALEELLEGSANIAVGEAAGDAFTGKESGNIDIGNKGEKGDNDIIRIGSAQSKAYIAGVYEKTVSSPSCGVVVSSVGQLGCKTTPSPPSDTAMITELNQEHARGERQQHEIDQLAGELRALRGEIARG
jgi:hypothetical protein